MEWQFCAFSSPVGIESYIGKGGQKKGCGKYVIHVVKQGRSEAARKYESRFSEKKGGMEGILNWRSSIKAEWERMEYSNERSGARSMSLIVMN